MIRTRVCDLLGIDYPIIEGGMGEKQGVELSAAVSNAGGLGCVRQNIFYFMGEDSAKTVRKELHEIEALTDKPFAVNIRPAKEQLDTPGVFDAVLEERSKDPELARKLVAIIMSAGDGRPYVDMVKSAGLLYIQKVSSIKQAKRVEAAGADAVIAMGYEAAGHVGFDKVSSLVLVPMLVEAVNIPVIAAGGFCDAASFVAALALGAQGIEMGTRFIATHEAGFHPNVKRVVVEAEAKDADVAVAVFSNARMYKNNYWRENEEKTGGRSEDELSREFKETMIREQSKLMWEKQVQQGDIANCPIPLGQVTGRIHSILSVKEVIDQIMEGADQIIHNLAGRTP